jgi:uncharacterized protein with ParB-like and HNH nuclease domain
MAQNLAPERVGLMDLLRIPGTQFKIPPYQRNYTWTKNKEVKQLLDDLHAVLTGERTKHFLGIMIYLQSYLSAFQIERLVIDGQQRLTTIFILLYAIKTWMNENGMEDDANRLEKMYLINEFDKDRKFKLKPLVSDDHVYQQIVDGDIESITEKKSNVYLNFVYLQEWLTEQTATYSVDQILEALNKLYIVCIPISDDDYPQKIFESINATGAKLTASDLIRNFMLMPIKSDDQDVYYEKYWKKIEEYIDSDSKKMESYFRFFLMAKKRLTINKGSVYAEFTKWYEEEATNRPVKSIFIEIVRYAKDYYTIYKAPVDSLEKELQKPIKEFRRNTSEMPAPLLMELYDTHCRKDEHGKDLISASQLSSIISILTSYLMRRALCDLDTSAITKYFPTLLKEVLQECGDDFTNIVYTFKKYLINWNKGNSMEMPDDKKLAEYIRNANMYNLRVPLYAFFCKLESEDNDAVIDFSNLSIEHLMPQTPTPQWYEELGVDKETYELNVNRLGNLTLATRRDNSKMSNKVWQYKNEVLAGTQHLKMNIELLKKDKWNILEIDERTESLIKEIQRLYPYEAIKDANFDRISISINQDKIHADAYFYPENGMVMILKGSTLADVDETTEYSYDATPLRNELIENNYIEEVDGKLTFVSDYIQYAKSKKRTALSTAAAIILLGSRNGWDCWKIEDGRAIGELKELHDKFS